MIHGRSDELKAGIKPQPCYIDMEIQVNKLQPIIEHIYYTVVIIYSKLKLILYKYFFFNWSYGYIYFFYFQMEF